MSDAMGGESPGDVVAEAAQPTMPAGITRPSMWSSLWAAIALFWLTFARFWFARLG